VACYFVIKKNNDLQFFSAFVIYPLTSSNIENIRQVYLKKKIILLSRKFLEKKEGRKTVLISLWF